MATLRSPREIHPCSVRHAHDSEFLRLEDGPFWSHAQSQRLREERQDDADLVMVVDRLYVVLHAMTEWGSR